MSKLNKDTLFLIFEELQDDSKSLFSCLLVNRFWCETVIPILWRNPWCYDINYNNKNYLFIIIASYLSNDIKESLNIQLPSFSHQSLLFDYLSFCRSININTMNIITSIGSSLAYKQFILQQEFYNLFMKKFLEIKYLDMKSIKHQIFYFPEARLRFNSLCELVCDTSVDSSYFYGLAHLCQYIQRLIIINLDPIDYHGITKLISVQENLKYFEWKDDDELYPSGHHNNYNPIILALEKNANIINHLNIRFKFVCRVLPRVLPKFHKLKTLIINFLFFENGQLKMCVYRDLEIFRIDYYELKAASIIIENNGEHLKKIFLESPHEFDDLLHTFDDDSLTFIRKVYENCLSIEYLSLIFPPSNQHFNEFEKLLKTCQKLKTLLLAIPYMGEEKTEKKLLKILIRSAPINLREIRFLYDVKFSLKTLEEFLENWRGRPAISILTCEVICEEENYIKLINKYKNDGVIKDFRCVSFDDIINVDFKL